MKNNCQFFGKTKETLFRPLLTQLSHQQVWYKCLTFQGFPFLLLLVFQVKNFFRSLNSMHKDLAVSKNAYYRFSNRLLPVLDQNTQDRLLAKHPFFSLSGFQSSPSPYCENYPAYRNYKQFLSIFHSQTSPVN